jgi:hypothetical protein
MSKRALTFVEIDIDYCSRTYGSAPCTAALGVSGTKKCFNTFATCQDTANYNNSPLTLRYTYAAGYTGGITAVPSLVDLQHSPGRVRIAEDLGERASVRCVFEDHRHSDLDLDKYVSDRAYDPLTQGTYWGRFVARNKYLVGRPLRTYQGLEGDALADMEERLYLIESVSGPDISGRVSIVAKDPLRLADGDAGQAPAASTGQLSAAITSSDTSATLKPTGVGNSEYPASGKVAIGSEIMSFTRSGDTLTLTRAQNNTEADDHDADETVQLVLEYSADPPATILEDLLTTYAGVPGAYIDSTEWATSDTLFVGRNYSGIIAEPTPVRKLVSEILQQVGASMWWDEIGQEVRYQPLQVISGPPVVDDSVMLADSYAVRAQPDKRLSQVWTYFGRVNPLEDEDDESNYTGVAVTIEPTAEGENEYNRPAIRKVFSRWITSSARTAALDINAKLLARRRDPPRLLSFDLPRYEDGLGYRVGQSVAVRNWATQDDEGAPLSIPAQIVSVGSGWSSLQVIAEEFTFTEQEAPGGGAGGGGGLNPVRGIDIIVDEANVNIRSKYDTDYADPDDLLQPIDSVQTGADTITIAGHGYAEDARVILSGGTAPGGLTLGTVYYVINPTTDTFQLSATEGGSAINLTTSTATSSVRFVIDIPVVIDPGVQVYSTSTSSPALDIGSWPEGGVNITLTIRTGAVITGAGGGGGAGGTAGGGNGSAGSAGGTALYTRQDVTVANSGTIQGGGGGGGGGGCATVEIAPGEFADALGGGGGGGAGRAGGAGANFLAADGTLSAGGSGGSGTTLLGATGGSGGTGGAPGSSGSAGSSATGGDTNGSGGAGGAAGNAVDGDSQITYSAAGTITGPQVN